MNDLAMLQATECIEQMRLSVEPPEFGYKIQALAAHVLLRLDCQVQEINQYGHPDIVATRDAEELRFEIEAEVGGPRLRQLTNQDFASLIDSSGAVGYLCLGYQFPHSALDSGSSRPSQGQGEQVPMFCSKL